MGLKFSYDYCLELNEQLRKDKIILPGENAQQSEDGNVAGGGESCIIDTSNS